MSRPHFTRRHFLAAALAALTLACGDGPTEPRGPAGEYLLYESDGHPVGERYTTVVGDQVTITGGKLTIGGDSSVALRVSFRYVSSSFPLPPGAPMPAPITYETRGRIVDSGTSTEPDGTWDVYVYAWPNTDSEGNTETISAVIFVRGREARFGAYRFLRL